MGVSEDCWVGSRISTVSFEDRIGFDVDFSPMRTTVEDMGGRVIDLFFEKSIVRSTGGRLQSGLCLNASQR